MVLCSSGPSGSWDDRYAHRIPISARDSRTSATDRRIRCALHDHRSHGHSARDCLQRLPPSEMADQEPATFRCGGFWLCACAHGFLPDGCESLARSQGVALRLDIWTGWLAFFIFIPLAATSMDYCVRIMGPRWKALRRSVNRAAILTLVRKRLPPSSTRGRSRMD